MEQRLSVVPAMLHSMSRPVPTAAQNAGKLCAAFEGKHPPFNALVADEVPFKSVDLVRCGGEQDEVSLDLMAGLIDGALAEIMADGGDRRIRDRCFAFEVMPAWVPKR